MISRIFSLLLLLTICSPAMGFSVRTEHWNEDVVLHDGRTIKVERNVEWTFRIASGDAGSGFALFKNWPDRYWLKFTHPITQKAIEWQGEQFFDPVLLGLVDDVPYLVILGQPDKKTEKIYGCPELPYIFLKYEKGVWGKWVPIPVDQAPDSLRDANLSPNFNHRIKSGAKLSRNDVLWNIQEVEGSSGGFFQSKIPRGYEEWFYGGDVPPNLSSA